MDLHIGVVDTALLRSVDFVIVERKTNILHRHIPDGQRRAPLFFGWQLGLHTPDEHIQVGPTVLLGVEVQPAPLHTHTARQQFPTAEKCVAVDGSRQAGSVEQCVATEVLHIEFLHHHVGQARDCHPLQREVQTIVFTNPIHRTVGNKGLHSRKRKGQRNRKYQQN